MNKLGEKSLKTLEYYEILEKLAGQAASQAAKEKCRALRPLDDHEQAELWLQQTTDAKEFNWIRSRSSRSLTKFAAAYNRV